MTSKELYAKHWAEMADGSPLRHACNRVLNGTASADDLIAFARWELWEAIYSLPPDPPAGEERGRHVDGFHAGCCASRAEGALRQLKKLLAPVGNTHEQLAEYDREEHVIAVADAYKDACIAVQPAWDVLIHAPWDTPERVSAQRLLRDAMDKARAARDTLITVAGDGYQETPR